MPPHGEHVPLLGGPCLSSEGWGLPFEGPGSVCAHTPLCRSLPLLALHPCPVTRGGPRHQSSGHQVRLCQGGCALCPLRVSWRPFLLFCVLSTLVRLLHRSRRTHSSAPVMC